MTLPRPLRGIVPPLVTPLRDRDELDVPGLERLVEHVLGGGVAGLFLLGTTGEAPSLGYRLRYELVEPRLPARSRDGACVRGGADAARCPPVPRP